MIPLEDLYRFSNKLKDEQYFGKVLVIWENGEIKRITKEDSFISLKSELDSLPEDKK
jgi:hypothetical protein